MKTQIETPATMEPAAHNAANAEVSANHTHAKAKTSEPEFLTRELTDLKPHPDNVKLYGERESLNDLLKSIPKIGLLDPIVITPEGTIISGHRRYRALLKLEHTTAMVRLIEPANETEMLATLLEYNRHRIKTKLQITREAQLQMRIEKERAAARKAAKEGEVEKLPPDSKGKARDKVGRKLGVSGRTVDKAIKAIEAADKAREGGRPDISDAIEAALDKGADTGLQKAVELGAITAKKRKAPKAAPTQEAPEPAPTQEAPAKPLTDITGDPATCKTIPTGGDTSMPVVETVFVGSERVMELADAIVTFLRLLKPGDLTDQQRRDLSQVFNQIATYRKAANL